MAPSSGTPTKILLFSTSTLTHTVCPAPAQLIRSHRGCISWLILLGSSPKANRYNPETSATTAQSSPTSAPSTEGLPTVPDTCVTGQVEGNPPLSCVRYIECSFTK